jgi:hypothetical protein
LKDATREYLSILAESDTPLSPRIAHHALYVPLLRVVDTDWITTVVGAPGSGQDAS